MNKFDYLTGNVRFVDIASKDSPFETESGSLFTTFPMAYETFGPLSGNHDNVAVVCHALTGHSHVTRDCNDGTPAGWWESVVGPGKSVDTRHHHVICFNVPGSCYGSPGPLSYPPHGNQPYGPTFPEITVRDMVRAQMSALQKLGITHIRTLLGGSLGGMQVLEWLVMYPGSVNRAVVLAAPACHQPWAVAFNHLARQAIMNDPAWKGGYYTAQPAAGIRLARQIAMVSYRAPKGFNVKFPQRGLRGVPDMPSATLKTTIPHHDPESYLLYQGDKFVKRFDANSYLILSRAMDLYDLSRDRAPLAEVLQTIDTPVLWIGIDSDILYPAAEIKKWCDILPKGRYAEIQSPHGHDAFLIEFNQIDMVLTDFFTKFNKNRVFYESNRMHK